MFLKERKCIVFENLNKNFNLFLNENVPQHRNVAMYSLKQGWLDFFDRWTNWKTIFYLGLHISK